MPKDVAHSNNCGSLLRPKRLRTIIVVAALLLVFVTVSLHNIKWEDANRKELSRVEQLQNDLMSCKNALEHELLDDDIAATNRKQSQSDGGHEHAAAIVLVTIITPEDMKQMRELVGVCSI